MVCTPQEFPDGGCWILKVRKQSGVLSKMWQDLVLGALGEGFDEPGVVGVALAIRTKEDMLSVWHRNNANDKIFIGCVAPRAMRVRCRVVAACTRSCCS